MRPGRFGTSFLPAGTDRRQGSTRDETPPPDKLPETERMHVPVDCVGWSGARVGGEGEHNHMHTYMYTHSRRNILSLFWVPTKLLGAETRSWMMNLINPYTAFLSWRS